MYMKDLSTFEHSKLKEGLLDLRVFPGRAFSHQGMVESEGFMVSMFAAPDHEALLSRLRCVS